MKTNKIFLSAYMLCSSMGLATQTSNLYPHNMAQEQLNIGQVQLATNSMLQAIWTGQRTDVGIQQADRNVMFFLQQQETLEKTELYKAYKKDESDYMHIDGSDRLLTFLFGENAHNQEAIIPMITFEFFSNVLVRYGLKQTKYLRVMVMNYLAQAFIKKGFLDAYNIVFTQILQLINEATFVPVYQDVSQDFYNEIFLPAGLVNTEEGNKKIVEKVGFKSPEIEQHIEDKLKKAAQFRKYKNATLMAHFCRKNIGRGTCYEMSKEKMAKFPDEISEEKIMNLAEWYCPELLKQCLDPKTKKLPIDIDMARIWVGKYMAVENGMGEWSRKMYSAWQKNTHIYSIQDLTFLADQGINYEEYEFAAVYQNNPKGGKELGQSFIVRDIEAKIRQRGFREGIFMEKMKNIGQYYVNNVILVKYGCLFGDHLNPYAPSVFIFHKFDRYDGCYSYEQIVLRTKDYEPDKIQRPRPVNIEWWKLNVLPRIRNSEELKKYNFLKMCLKEDKKVREKIKRKIMEIKGKEINKKREEINRLSKNMSHKNVKQLSEVGREITRLSKEIELFFEKEMQKMEESERPLPEMKRQDME
ncbi:MAG: hypothetical protein LBP31_02405, partial [Holosporales bacterium]|nr:hypothetical protein [Holosporales bacterium]